MTTLRRLARTTGGAGFPHAEQGHNSGDLPFIKVSDFNHIGNERVITTCNNWVTNETARRLRATVVPTGSVLLPKVGAALLGNARRIVSQPSVFDNNILGIVPGNIGSRYLHHWLTTVDAARFAKPGPVPSMDDSAVLSLRVPIVSVQKQGAIADYLDTETSRIDTLITKKRRMIELVQQRWRAEVMNTIYGDRSIRQGAIRYVVDLQPGYAFPSSRFVEEGTRLLRGANIAPGRLRWESDVVCVPREDRIALSEYELAENDLVLGMDRPFIGTGTRVATVTESDLPCILVQRVARIRATEHSDTRYIRLLIESDEFVAHLTPVFTGVSVPHVSAEQILSFRAPLPSRDAQRTIATHLERRRVDLSVVADLLAVQVNLLAERRRALITAAVTGGLRIPEGGATAHARPSLS